MVRNNLFQTVRSCYLSPCQVIDAVQKLPNKADADACIGIERGLDKLLRGWPMVDGGGDSGLVVGSAQVGWGADLRDLGLDRKEVLERLKKCHVQMSKRIADSGRISEGKLRKACTQADAALGPLSAMLQSADGNFQQTMRGSAANLASLQSTMQVQLGAVDTLVANNLGSPLDVKLVALSHALSAKIQYFVAVYAALTFYRTAETWKPNSKTGAKNKQSLAAALTSLNSEDRVVACELEYSHKIVAQMRKDMQVPARKLKPATSVAASGPAPGEAETIAPTMASGQSSGALLQMPTTLPEEVPGEVTGSPLCSPAEGSARGLGDEGNDAMDEVSDVDTDDEKGDEDQSEEWEGCWLPRVPVAKGGQETDEKDGKKATGAKRSRRAALKEQRQDLQAAFKKGKKH